jgi:uncharacterized protein with HEPN domain
MKRYDVNNDITRLQDILDAIKDIEELLSIESRGRLDERALERCFEIIGEACKIISTQLQNKYPDVPWANIISLRNRIIHEYDKIVTENLWDIAEHKIPSLRDWIEGILEKIKQ